MRVRGQYDLTLYEYLKARVSPCRLTTRKDESIIRCPFCGDSMKSKKSAHLYIQNIPPFKYFCQRCNATGIFDEKVIRLLKLDNTLNGYLKNSYDSYIGQMNRKYGNSLFHYMSSTEEPVILPNQYTELETEKIKYFNERLGVSITEEEVAKFRIILNLEDFFINNKLTSTLDDRKVKLIKHLNENYFCYLLNDKNTINCRNIKDGKWKHFKLNIHEDTKEMSKRFYSIKNNIDLKNTIFNIHLAEGFFDIMAIYYHVNNKQIDDSTLYIANNGKGYKFTLMYLASIGILNANINIYSDLDVTLDSYRKFTMLGNDTLTKLNAVNIYYNNEDGEKDFGTTPDKIKVSEPAILKI